MLFSLHLKTIAGFEGGVSLKVIAEILTLKK